MATINFLKRKDSKNSGALGSVIAYCTQRYKTEIEDTNVRLISGVNCLAERAFKDFMDTKKQFNKTDGVQFYYAIQSFEEETNIEPMLAHQIAMEWVEKCYPGYQALVCTHMDTDNIHSHIIINSVSSLDGHKIHQNKNDIERVRYVNDQLCMKYGLPICQPKKKVQGVNSKEYYAAKAGNSWKTQLAIDIDNAMLYAKSKMDFIKLMNKKGYRVIWTNKRDTILYQCPNGKRCRDFKLHEDKYLKGAMENEFTKRKEYLRKYEGYDETGTDASDLRSDNRGKLGKSISLLAHQISIMEQQQDILQTMITTEQMAGLINSQTENMQTYIENLGSITEKHSKVMKAIESDFNKSVIRQTSVLKDETKETMKEISLQAGRMKDDFSNSLSMEKEHMKDTLLKQRIINWALTAMQVLSLGALILWVTSQTF